MKATFVIDRVIMSPLRCNLQQCGLDLSKVN
jgi:hypothetical protein